MASASLRTSRLRNAPTCIRRDLSVPRSATGISDGGSLVTSFCDNCVAQSKRRRDVSRRNWPPVATGEKPDQKAGLCCNRCWNEHADSEAGRRQALITWAPAELHANNDVQWDWDPLARGRCEQPSLHCLTSVRNQQRIPSQSFHLSWMTSCIDTDLHEDRRVPYDQEQRIRDRRLPAT